MPAITLPDLNNAKLDVDHIADIATSTALTATDRLGQTKRTLKGQMAAVDAELASKLDNAQSQINVKVNEAAGHASDSASSALEAYGYLQAYRATSYGALESDPATDPLGNPPTVGDEYFNIPAKLLKRWNGVAWQASDISTANLAASSGSSLVGYDGGTVQDVLDAVTGPYGAASVGYTPAGTGAVSTTVQQQLRNIQAWTVNVKDAPFYAKGDGVTDDTAAIQAAIDAVASGGRVVGDAQSVFNVTGRINLSNKELRDIRLTYTTNNAMLVLGGKARLTNVTISVGTTIRTFVNALPGVINLHLATGVVIDNVEITDGISGRVGVFCSTRASNTTIRNCRMNYIGWPILYNDAYPAQRIVDGIDYAGQSIGSGLYVHGCELGAADKTAVGDAIEINCPSQRFSNIRVVNCTTLKTVSSSDSNGLGFGFANCDTLQVSDCLLKNVAASAGAIHIEAHTSASITNNVIESCNIGIGVGITGVDCLITGNTIDACVVAIQCISNDTSLDGLTITGNQLLNSSGTGIVLLNVISAIITNNLLKDITGTGGSRQYIALQQSGSGTSTRYTISGNIFSKVNGNTYPLLTILGTVSEVFSRGNIFTGIGANEVGGYMISVRSIGMSEDHYRSAGSTSALHGTITTTPAGYITGSAGDFMTDVNAGVLYRHDGTNWVAKVS